MRKIDTEKIAGVFLLLCATTQCVLSIFYVNLSYLDLSKYAAGLEPLPFQRRLLMVPFVRWAESNHWLQTGGVRFTKTLTQYEPMSAAKFGCMLLGVLLVNALGLWTIRISKRLAVDRWWLIWALMLVIVFSSYAARFEQALWYPYDLPHMVFFGVATLFLLMDNPFGFLAAFSVDVFLRETSAFLIVVAALLHVRSKTWRVVIALGAAVWVFGRWLAQHLYPDNRFSSNGVPWFRMIAPWHWPQLFSIVGFLWIPVWLGARYLTKQQRLALAAASVLMVVTFYFATWNETRAWSEWTMLFAVLAALEMEGALGNSGDRSVI